MDTTAYLTRQGWRGHGHSLNPSGRGLAKPLLISRKLNVLGIGKKTHDVDADQWWARAFDASLKDLDIGGKDAVRTIESAETKLLGASRVPALLKGPKENRDGTGGLYAGFVKGEGLSGTITPNVEDVSKPACRNLLARMRRNDYEQPREMKSKERTKDQPHKVSDRQLFSWGKRKVRDTSFTSTRTEHSEATVSKSGPTDTNGTEHTGTPEQLNRSSVVSEYGHKQVHGLSSYSDSEVLVGHREPKKRTCGPIEESTVSGFLSTDKKSNDDSYSPLGSKLSGVTVKKPRRRARTDGRIKRHTKGTCAIKS